MCLMQPYCKLPQNSQYQIRHILHYISYHLYNVKFYSVLFIKDGLRTFSGGLNHFKIFQKFQNNFSLPLKLSIVSGDLIKIL